MTQPENPPPETAGSRQSVLASRTINSFLWTFSGTGFQAVLRIVVVAILSRLLLPADFGIVGAALTVVALADLFTQVGVAPSVVQAETLTRAYIRTAFSVTVVMGMAVGLLTYFLAPFIADAFRMPELEPVVRSFWIIFVVRGFASIAEAILQREMRFREIATNAITSYIFGYAVCSVALAYAGYGIWALVTGMIMQNVLSSLGFILRARHSMRPMFDTTSLKHLFVFGTGMTLARVGNYIATNADNLVVGRWLGAEALGFYSRAYVLLMQPAQLFGSAADKVMFPAMASIQLEEDRLARSYHRAVALVALTTLPLSGVIIALAPEIVFLLLGDRWGSVVFPLQILVSALFFRTAYKITGALLRSRGAVYRHAVWQWTYAITVVLGAWLGQHYGIVGVAIGVSIAVTFSFWSGVIMALTSVALSPLKMLVLLARYTALAVALGLMIWAMKLTLPLAMHPIITLFAGGTLATIVCLAMWFLVPKFFGDEGKWVRDQIASRIASTHVL